MSGVIKNKIIIDFSKCSDLTGWLHVDFYIHF